MNKENNKTNDKIKRSMYEKGKLNQLRDGNPACTEPSFITQRRKNEIRLERKCEKMIVCSKKCKTCKIRNGNFTVNIIATVLAPMPNTQKAQQQYFFLRS